MNSQDYLNQISAASQPVSGSHSSGNSKLNNILHSKFFLIGFIGLAIFILILVIGQVLGGTKVNLRTELVQLKFHIGNTSSLISTYQPNLKSSELRSYSASLQSILSVTDSNLTSYLTEEYNYKESEEDEGLSLELATERDALENELFEAKINGVLDRTYARKMTYEISIFMSEESKIYNSARDESLRAIIDQSYSSLENLYDNFNNFSEAKQ
ncbi:hypothetical protein IKG60_02450 [Candidatus Saccharibacteria bacterium]|nr:hypothetical protein [Candidatus Saccharibacteria bacterium]